MTAVGIITVVGLLVTYFHVASDKIGTCVHKAWWALFLPFCAVTASYNLGADASAHFWFYAVPAIAACGWMLYTFRHEIGFTVGAFCSLFVLNMLGNFFGLSRYAIVTVDLLDVFVWTQIVLLWRMGAEHPDEILQRSLNHNPHNVFRVIHGRAAGELRNGT